MKRLLLALFAIGCGRVDLDVPDSGIHDASTDRRVPVDAAKDAPADALTCQAGSTACNGKCVDLQGDSKNCGKCGNACMDPQVCAQGSCTTSCPIGRSKCGNSCVDTLTDPQNCGGCGIGCNVMQACTMGMCCDPNATICSGKCVDTQNDKNNCGMCGKTCPGSCNQGQCCEKPPTGMCTHALCDMGMELVAKCDGMNSCVDKICQQDDFCCMVQWDSLCVSEVDQYCGPQFSCMCK